MHSNSKSESYAAAGVDITAGYKAVELAAKKLAGENVSDVGIAGVWYNAENIDEMKNKNIFYMG